MYQSTNSPLKILVILGSTRPNRNGERVAKYVMNKLKEAGHEPKLADPVELKLPLLETPYHFYPDPADIPENVKNINEMVKEADGYVLVSPEYNRNIPPALSNLLDYVKPSFFGFKASAIVTYSIGFFPPMMCVALLRSMMVEFGAPPIPFIFSIGKVNEILDEDGNTKDESLGKKSIDMITQLEWYTKAMKNHKAAAGEPEWGPMMSGPSSYGH